MWTLSVTPAIAIYFFFDVLIKNDPSSYEVMNSRLIRTVYTNCTLLIYQKLDRLHKLHPTNIPKTGPYAQTAPY